jgi:hypothetical protein
MHVVAEPFAQTMTSYSLDLISPKGVTTWESRDLTSTIDITFTTQGIQDRLISC